MSAVQVLRRSCWEAVRPYGTALLGALVWLAAVILLLPSPLDVVWAKVLFMLAPLVLLPLALRLIAPSRGVKNGLWQAATRLQLPAALFLGGAFLLPQGLAAAALALPWVVTTGLLALVGLMDIRRRGWGPLSEFCVDAGLIYGVIGSGWAVLDRWGVRPLDFEGVIVLLTAIHFHYAGILLPVLTGLALRQGAGRLATLTGVGVVVAVPLTAVGITATQLHLGPSLECLAAWLMAAGGGLTGWQYVCLARQRRWPTLVRGLWFIAAGSLLASMGLAALYGSRFFLPLSWLDIPWMRALHGTANAFGFGLAGLLGWTLVALHGEIEGDTTIG